jgi:transposase InsO family protein
LIEEACAGGARLDRACEAVLLSPRTVQRWRFHDEIPSDGRKAASRNRVPANKLTETERSTILETANQEKFASLPPSQIVPKLADEGVYIASESTFYRTLRAEKQLAHRGRTKPAKNKRPDALVATDPNQVWSWDITYRAPRPDIGRGRILGMHRERRFLFFWVMPCSSLWKSMSPSGGDLLLTGRVT